MQLAYLESFKRLLYMAYRNTSENFCIGFAIGVSNTLQSSQGQLSNLKSLSISKNSHILNKLVIFRFRALWYLYIHVWKADYLKELS